MVGVQGRLKHVRQDPASVPPERRPHSDNELGVVGLLRRNENAGGRPDCDSQECVCSTVRQIRASLYPCCRPYGDWFVGFKDTPS